MDLYRLPWSKNDNPNGWIEVTTKCNMACKGCYRGCDRAESNGVHKSLEEVKKEIDMMKEIRNCQTISLSGGEPTIYPYLKETIRYIKKQGMDASVFTNGKLITEEFVRELKEAGLNGLIIRVDSLRDGGTEKGLNKKRQHYADILNKIGGITFGFCCCVSKKNINQLKYVYKWFREDKTHGDIMSIVTMKEVMFKPTDKVNVKEHITVKEIRRNLLDMKFAGFLGSSEENMDIKWLLGAIYDIFGQVNFADKKQMEKIIMKYHLKNGRYFYIPKKKEMKELGMPWRLVLIVNSPGMINGKRDFCDGCPDAMLYKGKLVPSCYLEELKWREYAKC